MSLQLLLFFDLFLLVLFLSTLTAVLIDTTTLNQLKRDYQHNSTRHNDFMLETREKYQLDSNSAENNNIMGVLHFIQNNITEALRYFEIACVLSNYADDEMVGNYASTLLSVANDSGGNSEINSVGGNSVGGNSEEEIVNKPIAFASIHDYYKQAVEVIQKGIVAQPKSFVLKMMLTQIYTNAQDYSKAVALSLRLIKDYPLKFATWNNFAHVDTSYRYYLVSIGATNRNLLNSYAYEIVITKGLKLFPKSSSLLYIRSLINFYKTDFKCAAYLMHKTLKYSSFTLDEMNTTTMQELVIFNRDLLLQKLELSEGELELYGSRGCFPFSLYQQETIRLYYGLLEPSETYLETIVNFLQSTNFSNSALMEEQVLQKFDEVNVNDTSSLNTNQKLKLHIGCNRIDHCVKEGWVVVDAVATVSTHVQTSAGDLRMFDDDTVDELYCSHTLEHVGHRSKPLPPELDNLSIGNVDSFAINDHEIGFSSNTFKVYEYDSAVCNTLAEWNRVMAPGATLWLSVPDLLTLSELFVEKNRTTAERVMLINFLYGGQINPYDYHYAGFTFDYLQELLEDSNFCNIRRVDQFGIFQDTSTNFVFNRSFSLNVVAEVCTKSVFTLPFLKCNRRKRDE